MKYLIDTCNYNMDALVRYLYNIYSSEGLSIYDALGTLYDYAYMSVDIVGMGKFNKYPRFLLSVHHIILNNYNIIHKEFDENKFYEIMEKYKKYKYRYRGYEIVIPETTKDIIQEGVSLRHCVISYINNILCGQTSILFVRESSDTKQSLLTLELKNDAVVQLKGLLNRNPTEKELKFVERFCKKFDLGLKIS